jgi:hypothetical protein
VNRRAGVLHGLLTADRGVTSNLSNPRSGDYPGFEFFKCNIALKLRECRDNNHRPPPETRSKRKNGCIRFETGNSPD